MLCREQREKFNNLSEKLRCVMVINNIYFILVLVDTYRTYGDELITMIHHGNQQVEQHNDVDQREASEHDEAPEPGELLDPGQLEVVQVYQAERRPEQGLRGLPEAEIIKCSEIIKLPLISNQIESIKF